MSRSCVTNLTHMLHVHACSSSNSISLFCLEGRIYVLKILQEILSFTCLLMINTRPLVGCVEKSDPKSKTIPCLPRIASRCLYIYHWHNILCANVSDSAMQLPICVSKLPHNTPCANRKAWALGPFSFYERGRLVGFGEGPLEKNWLERGGGVERKQYIKNRIRDVYKLKKNCPLEFIIC